MSEPLLNKRTQKPFQRYAASPSWLEQEESEYQRFLAEIKPRKEPTAAVTGRMLLAVFLVVCGVALALGAIIWKAMQ